MEEGEPENARAFDLDGWLLRVRDVREHKDATIVLEDTVIRGDHRDRVTESEPEPDLSATE